MCGHSLPKGLQALNEYLPLKQGLRQHPLEGYQDEHHLNEYLPLKQGLRPRKCCSAYCRNLTQ